MTYASNRRIPAAKAIDDFQDSIAQPNLRAPRDLSGWFIIGIPSELEIDTLSDDRLRDIRDNKDNGMAARVMAGELLIARSRLDAFLKGAPNAGK